MTEQTHTDELIALAERLRGMVSSSGKAIVCNGRSTGAMCDDILAAASALRAHAKENDDAS